MIKIMNHLQTGLMMILLIQYASYDKGNAIGFLVLLIGIAIMKTLIRETSHGIGKRHEGYTGRR